MSLQEKDVIPYWQDRVNKSAQAAVGFDAKNLKKQNERYHERRIFINPYLDKDLSTLDYGCGIGRYSDLFSEYKYLGVDIMENLLIHAKENNPRKTYITLPTPYLPKNSVPLQGIKQIFTATVLQHNSFDVIEKIFKSFYNNIINKAIRFVLYEKNEPNQSSKPHVQNVPPNFLAALIDEVGYDVDDIECRNHYIHNENHTLSIITTC